VTASFSLASTRITAFSAEHVPGAAVLLARRHAVHRRAEPLLPKIDDFEPFVAAELDGGSGAVALRADEVVGFLLGREEVNRVGRTLKSGVGGHAVTDPALIADLYVAAAERWVEDGLVRQNVFIPFLDELVEPWFRLSFGGAAMNAIRAVPEDAATDPASCVRLSTSDDLVDAARLERVLDEHLTLSPSFNGAPVPSQSEFEDDWRDMWDDEKFVHFVAEQEGKIVGYVLLYRRPPDLRVPSVANIDLCGCATDREVRGTGVGVALTDHVTGWAAEHGLKTMTADWRLTNLLAARFWPKRGFRPAFIRVYRSIP
jgi:ribosomal protein S18 acetylase RimI-like enzyme